MGMTPLKGDETPEEIIILAYGMEEGLGAFYFAMAERIEEGGVVSLLKKLGEVEEKHKEKLFKLYLSFIHETIEKETFEANIASEMMEGGFTTEEFLEQNQPAMETVADTLNVAMMLEAQALDLYSRYSQKAGDENTKNVLYDIAEEEKAHLAALGDLLEIRA